MTDTTPVPTPKPPRCAHGRRIDLACRKCREGWARLAAKTQGRLDIKLPVLRCLRCEHSWYPRHTEPPKRCPKCGSPYWDKPRR